MIALLVAFGAAAQDFPEPPALDADAWRVSVDSEHLVATDESTVPVAFQGRVDTHWAHQVHLGRDRSGEANPFLANVWSIDLAVAWGFKRLRVGAVMPVHSRPGQETPRLGDVWLDGKVQVLDRALGGPGLAGVARLSVPLGADDVWLGHPGNAYELGVVADVEAGAWVASVNLGHRGVPDRQQGRFEVSDQLWFRAGALYGFGEGAALALEAVGHTPYGGQGIGTPVELLLSGSRTDARGLLLRGGVGLGLTGAVGVPGWRVFVGTGQRAQPL